MISVNGWQEELFITGTEIKPIEAVMRNYRRHISEVLHKSLYRKLKAGVDAAAPAGRRCQ